MGQHQTQIWKQAVEIYSKISELPLNQAIVKLDKIHSLSYEIKQAVITLINSGNQASQYIRQNFTPDLIATPDMPIYEIGMVLGEYELIEKIGHGGMSQVFKAKRVNSELQKLIAIKIFSPKNHSPQLLEHFINEQKILSELSHPHIVDMLHGGKTEGGITYLVMELLENALPINKYCQQTAASVNKKIAYISQCANALGYSHANLIIHRDLKPDNILIDGNKQLKIVDFGIAKLINNDISGNKTTIMALTPSYAAPEQINSQNISVKTDIFSLAVVALELLTGEQFLPKDRLIKSCINDEAVIERHLKALKIDKDLKNILQQALQQNPQRRYANMQSFADDLNNYLASKPVNATSHSMFYRLRKFARRRTALFATLFALLTSLILGLAVTLWQYQQIKIEAGKAQQVKQFMLDSFAVTDPNVSEGLEISAKDILQIAANKINENQNLNPKIKFELYQTIGLAYGQMGFTTQATEFLKQSLKINPNDSKSQSFLAQFLQLGTQSHELNEVLEDIDVDKYSSGPDKARIYRIKAKILLGQGDFQASLDMINAISTFTNVEADNIANSRITAEIYFQMSQLDRAIDVLTATLAASSLKDTNTSTLGIKKDLVLYYTKNGEYDSALQVSMKLIEQLRTILGNRHPDLGDSLLQLSDVYLSKGDLPNALKTAQESHDIFVGLYGENNIKVAKTLATLGILSYRNNQLDKAEQQLTQSANVFANNYPAEHLETLEAKTNLAGFFNATNKTRKAEKLLREVYTVQLNNFGATHRTTIFTQQHLSRALAMLGDYT
ncbi:Serine/threonine protein kinase PrkC, regulator of stationary phase, partial [hydrothermal vent metagenome]